MASKPVSEVVAAMKEMPVYGDNDEMCADVAAILEAANFEVEANVYVPDRGDKHRGFISIVGRRDGESIAVEVDRVSPRKASLMKLAQYRADVSLVLLRYGPLRMVEVYPR